MRTLRPYQQEARLQVNTLLKAKRNPCFVCPTGGGKTFTSVKIIEDQIKLKKRMFVLCPQEEIFNQWVCDLSHLNPGTINQKGIQGKNRNVYVCMPLSLVNILPYIPEKIHPDIIFTDEAHHSSAVSWENIYNYFSNSQKVGLTATPQRTDGKGLDHIYTDIIQTISMKQLINKNNLSKPLTIVPEEYLEKIPILNGEYDLNKQANQLGKTRIIGDVLTKYSNIFGGLPVLVACSTYEHAKQMTKSFNETGWNWQHIHSKLPYNERKRMLREITTGKINGICTVGIGTEGLDIPGLYGLIWLRRTTSLTIYLQFNGRVLRTLPGKTHGIIIDPVGNCFIHGLPEADRTWTLKGREEETEDNEIKMKLCPSCGVMNSKENIECHFCGCILKDVNKQIKDRTPAIVEGNLVSIFGEDIPSLNKRSETIKMKQKKENSQQSSLIEICDTDKSVFLRKNIFKNKRSLLNETLENFS